MAARNSANDSAIKRWMSKYWFFLLTFVPMLQWMPCFVMNGKGRKKRWLFMGLAYIAIGLGCFVAIMAIETWSTNSYVRYPEGPSEEDYRDFTYDDFEKEDGSIDWDAYYAKEKDWRKNSEGYKEYQAAYKEHTNSPEYKAVEAKNSRRYMIVDLVTGAASMIVVLKYFIYIVWIYFIERYRYKDIIEEKDRKKQVYKTVAQPNNPGTTKNIQDNWSNMASGIVATPTPAVSSAPVRMRPESDVIPDEVNGALNINTATEAQIEALPLISVIDAKKIIDYRNKNGGFTSIDEFFQCFNAKPHVIVKLQDAVTVNQVSVKTAVNESPVKKRFDI